MSMTIRSVSTIIAISLSETNTIGYYGCASPHNGQLHQIATLGRKLSPSGQITFGHDDIVLQANTDWCDQGDRYLAKIGVNECAK